MSIGGRRRRILAAAYEAEVVPWQCNGAANGLHVRGLGVVSSLNSTRKDVAIRLLCRAGEKNGQYWDLKIEGECSLYRFLSQIH